MRLADGSAETMYLSFFAFLTYLRQLTAHPFLAERLLTRYWTAEDIRSVREKLGKHGGQMTLVQQLQACHRRRGIAGPEQPRGRDRFFSMHKMLAGLVNLKNGIEGLLCGICGEIPVDPHISDVSTPLSKGGSMPLTTIFNSAVMHSVRDVFLRSKTTPDKSATQYSSRARHAVRRSGLSVHTTYHFSRTASLR